MAHPRGWGPGYYGPDLFPELTDREWEEPAGAP